MPALVEVQRAGSRGEAALRAAERALREEDPEAAHTHLDEAGEAFSTVARRLRSPVTLPARLVPGVRRQLVTTRALADAGEHLTDAGLAAVEALEARPPDGWQMSEGRIDLDVLRRLHAGLTEALPATTEALRTVEATPERFLAAPVGRRRTQALERTREAVSGTLRALAGLEAAPALLGEGERRRYFLAFGNLTELRGTGGFLGHFAVLEARDGRLRYVSDESGRPTRELDRPRDVDVDVPEWYRSAYARYGALGHWANLNMTTDFPTVGHIALQTIPPELQPIHGFVQVDAHGLAALLRVAGSLEVSGWPEPVTADNIGRITQHDAELRFADDNQARVRFLDQLIDEVFEHFLSADIPIRQETIELLASVVSSGGVQVYAAEPDEQAALRAVGLAHEADRDTEATDVLGVVTQNAIGNKADWFLHREIGYEVDIDPIGGRAKGRLDVTLRNEAPDEGLPSRVIGSRAEGIPQGSNRQIVVLLRPDGSILEDVAVDGEPVQVSGDREASLRAHHRMVTIPSEGEVRLTAAFETNDGFTVDGRSGTYRLRVLRQPSVNPDRYEIQVNTPPGWRATTRTSASAYLTEDTLVEVEMTHRLHAWAFETAVLRPWWLARDLVGRLFS